MRRRAPSRAFAMGGIAVAALVMTLVVASISTDSILGGPPRHHETPLTRHGPLHGLNRARLDAPLLPPWLGVALAVVLLLALVAVALLARGARQTRQQRLLFEEEDDDGGSDWAAMLSVELGDAAAEQLRQLTHGSPRNAIVACWLRLQQATERAGLAAEPAETSHEFTLRVLRRLRLDGAAITTLSELYREARFSDHEMREEQRTQAIGALGVLASQLTPRTGDESNHTAALSLDSVSP